MEDVIQTKMRKLQLWFFRDLNDEQRLSLFKLHGLPIDEIRSQYDQLRAFQWVFNPPKSSTPKPTNIE